MAKPVGRVAVVLPQGALFRGGAEAKIRQAMLDADLIEAVIGLGPNLFYGTGLAASVLILRASKQPERTGKVLFINGETLYKRGRNQNTLEPDHATQLLDLYNGFTSADGLACVVEAAELRAHRYNLNIPLYVDKVAGEEPVTLAAAVTALDDSQKAAALSRSRLEALLAEWGLS
jgi:type I restriction enzyme M protein